MTNHLTPKAKDLLEKPIKERLDYFRKDRWIKYPQAIVILEELERLLEYPRRERMPNLALVAETNNGKTRLLRHFESLHPASDRTEGEAIEVPVLYLQCKSGPNDPKLYSSILERLFRKHRPTASPDQKLSMVLDALRETKVRLLIIDEVNYAAGGSVNRQKTFIDSLRYLGGELQLPIVLAGTDEMLNIIRTIPSADNRFKPATLPRWGDNEEFRQLLKAFEATIPLNEPSNLGTKAMSSSIYNKCGGTIGEVKNMLEMAAEYVMKKDKPCIEWSDIDKCGYRSPSERRHLRVG